MHSETEEDLSTSTTSNRRTSKSRESKQSIKSSTQQSHTSSQPKPSSSSHKKRRICLNSCRYEVVKNAALECGFCEVTEKEFWNINWTDSTITAEKSVELKRLQDNQAILRGQQPAVQKTNHFPGIYEICRKDRLARNLNRMKKFYPSDFNFFPPTWSLPTELSEILAYAKTHKNATYIVKPESGSQGKGIFLTKSLRILDPHSRCICQLYMPHPLLIDGYKFDFRIYALVTSCDPLRLYVYNEGIARFATVKYREPNDNNLDVVFMHLTNYSLNKHSEAYVPVGEGSKRKMSTVLEYLKNQGYAVQELLDAIDEILVKTVLTAIPEVRHQYRISFPRRSNGCCCFELLGFDILIDRNFRPVLLEVNHSPSFNVDLSVDESVKKELLRDLLGILYLGKDSVFNPNDAMSKNLAKKVSKSVTMKAPLGPSEPRELSKSLIRQFNYEDAHKGNFRLIFPSESFMLKYGMFLEDKVLNSQSAAENLCLQKRHLDKQLKSIVNSTANSRTNYRNPNNNLLPPGSHTPHVKTNSTLRMASSGHMYVDTRKKTPPNESYMVVRKRVKSRTNTNTLTQSATKSVATHQHGTNRRKPTCAIRSRVSQSKPDKFSHNTTGSHALTALTEQPFKVPTRSSFLLHRDVQSSRQNLGWEKPPRFLAANYYCPVQVARSQEMIQSTYESDLTTEQLVERMQSIIETLTAPNMPSDDMDNLLEPNAAKKPRIRKTLERVRKEQAEMEKRKHGISTATQPPKRSSTAVTKNVTASRVTRGTPVLKERINNCSYCNCHNVAQSKWLPPFKYDDEYEEPYKPKGDFNKKRIKGRMMNQPKEVVFGAPSRRYSFLQGEKPCKDETPKVEQMPEAYKVLNGDKDKEGFDENNNLNNNTVGNSCSTKSRMKSSRKEVLETDKRTLIKDWIEHGEMKSWANDINVRRGIVQFDFPKKEIDVEKNVPSPVEDTESSIARRAQFKGNRQKQQEEMLELKMRTMRHSLRKSGTLSFNPLPLNDKEETMRLKELAERKNEIRVLGIEEKLLQALKTAGNIKCGDENGNIEPLNE